MRLFPSRKEQKNVLDKSRWMLWRWFDIIIDNELYLSRLTLFNTPWFGLRLHWIHKPDPDRGLHTHPWSFLSLVLRGGYNEIISKDPANVGGKERSVRWFNRMNTTSGHRIVSIKSNTMTLVLTGRKQKDWGFWISTDDNASYLPHREYMKLYQK